MNDLEALEQFLSEIDELLRVVRSLLPREGCRRAVAARPDVETVMLWVRRRVMSLTDGQSPPFSLN